MLLFSCTLDQSSLSEDLAVRTKRPHRNVYGKGYCVAKISMKTQVDYKAYGRSRVLICKWLWTDRTLITLRDSRETLPVIRVSSQAHLSGSYCLKTNRLMKSNVKVALFLGASML